MKFIVEIDERTHAAKVTFPSGEVTVYDRCDLSQSREIIPEYDIGALTVSRYTATGKESLTLSMTSEAQPHRRTEM
jgi:hypothetical protein